MLKFPYKIVDLDEKINSELSESFSNGIPGFVQVGDEKWLFANKYRDEAEKLYNFPVRSDDIWVTGYPRSGTTLTQEIVWLVMNNGDIQRAKNDPQRITFLERNVCISDGLRAKLKIEKDPTERENLNEFLNIVESTFEHLSEKPSPRFIKTHLPYSLLPHKVLSTCKIVYVCRNIKDILISYHKLQSTLTIGREFNKGFEKYWEYFKNNYIYFNPYWQHVRQGWENRFLPNVHFVFYENLTKDLKGSIRDMCKFFGKHLNEETINNIEDYLSINNFRKILKERKSYVDDPTTKEGFIGSGKIGGWKDHINDKINQEINEWIENNLKKIPNLKHVYPLN